MGQPPSKLDDDGLTWEQIQDQTTKKKLEAVADDEGTTTERYSPLIHLDEVPAFIRSHYAAYKAQYQGPDCSKRIPFPIGGKVDEHTAQ